MTEKKLACFFCKELKSHRISEHLLSVHKEEEEVKPEKEGEIKEKDDKGNQNCNQYQSG